MFKMSMGNDMEYLKLGLLRETQLIIIFFLFLIKDVNISEVYCLPPEKSHTLLFQNPKTQPFLQIHINCFCSYLLCIYRNRASPIHTLESNLWKQALTSNPQLDNVVTRLVFRNWTRKVGVVMWVLAQDIRLFSVYVETCV